MVTFIVGLALFAVGVYAFKRKMDIVRTWERNVEEGLRNWDTEPILRARETFEPNVFWTLVMIIFGAIGWCLVLIAVFGFLGFTPSAQ